LLVQFTATSNQLINLREEENPMSTVLKWIARIFGVLIGLLLLIFVMAAVLPAQADADVGENHGAGASSVQPSYTGLQREFPALNETAVNPTTPEKAELGQLLFFDPILSQNNDTACATCHQPDLGFSDGRIHAIGPTGVEQTRNTPGLMERWLCAEFVLGRPSRYPRSPVQHSPHPPG
jgi:cytochrome c peroxidase